MQIRNITIVIALILYFITLRCTSQDDFPHITGSYFGLEPPSMNPEIFAPGIITTEYHEHCSPMFSPDGSEVYWSVFYNFWGPQVIVFMSNENNQWTKPRVAPFSGQYSDGNPCLSPDGQKLFFESRRPIHEDDPYTGNIDLWIVERDGNDWSKPKNLGSKVNTDKWERGPSVSDNGNLYFCSMRDGGYGLMDLYCSKFVEGSYSEPENLGSQINTPGYESWPFIASDESYLIYESDSDELYISFRNNDSSWSQPTSISEEMNFTGGKDRFPRLSNDGRYLFFVSNRWLGNPYFESRLDLDSIKDKSRSISNGMGNVFWVDAAIIEDIRKAKMH
jgi:Tol biopolymer transport system component